MYLGAAEWRVAVAAGLFVSGSLGHEWRLGVVSGGRVGNVSGGGLLSGAVLAKPTKTKGKDEKENGIFSTLSGLEFSGYEIHMGKTTVSTGEHQTPLVQLADGRTDGVQRMEKGSEAPGVYGSYVHGIFDDGDIAVRIVQALADKKRVSWKPEAGGDYHAFKEQQYDKLAQGLREHLDMEYVYSILQESRISS